VESVPDGRPARAITRALAGGRAVFKHWKVAVVVLALAALAVGFVRFYGPASPVQDGLSEDLWYAATKIRLTEGRVHDKRLDALYDVKDGYFLYYRNDPKELIVYRVGQGDVQRDLAPMVQRIEAEPAESVEPWVKQGMRVWVAADPDRENAAELVQVTGRQQVQWLEKEQPSQLALVRLREVAVRDRWWRDRWYPWVAAGEFLYLAGLVLFGAWPLLRKTGPVSWAVHFGLVPVLLFLPFWLGYASGSFSPTGLKGGVVYPSLVSPFSFLPNTAIDSSIAAAFPKVLESVAPIDSAPKTKSPQGEHAGALSVLALGAVVGVTTYGLRNMRRLRLRALLRRRRRERQEERARVEEQAREWEGRRAEVLAEVRRLLEGEILPKLERRLRDEVLQALDGRLADGGFGPENGQEFEVSADESGRETFAATALHLENDFPLPFEKMLPRVAGRSLPDDGTPPSAVESPAENTGGNNGSPGASS
jgi:hypothetical protein